MLTNGDIVHGPEMKKSTSPRQVFQVCTQYYLPGALDHVSYFKSPAPRFQALNSSSAEKPSLPQCKVSY